MTDNKKEYTIIQVKSYTKYSTCYGFYNDTKVVYKKFDDIINHFYSNNTKDLIGNYKNVETIRQTVTLKKLYQDITNNMLAVFPINSTTYLSDIKPYIKMGFKVVFMSHKDYKQFKKDYQDFITL